MRPVSTVKLVLLPAILLISGCMSNNKGKIEVTRWTSLATTIKGQSIPAGTVKLAFGGDGRVIYTCAAIGSLPEQTYRGTYGLGMADFVTLEFDTELAGRKSHTETIVINGDRLTMTDTDGTSIAFAKVH